MWRTSGSVSYTHLDVYKRQVLISSEPVLLKPEEVDHSSRYKNHYLSSLGGAREGKLVYVRRIDDVELISGELGYLYVCLLYTSRCV